MKKWFIYIVLCSRGAYYTGITTNLLKRIAQHNSGKGAKSIKALGSPVCLVYSEISGSKSAALKREYEIKQMTRAEKIELINGRFI